MNVKVSRSLAASFAIAAALALPTAVKAQSNNVATTASTTSTYAEELSTEANLCVQLPIYGWICY